MILTDWKDSFWRWNDSTIRSWFAGGLERTSNRCARYSNDGFGLDSKRQLLFPSKSSSASEWFITRCVRRVYRHDDRRCNFNFDFVIWNSSQKFRLSKRCVFFSFCPAKTASSSFTPLCYWEGSIEPRMRAIKLASLFLRTNANADSFNTHFIFCTCSFVFYFSLFPYTA